MRKANIINQRVSIGNTFRPFQSVELSLQRLLPSRAIIRFTQRIKFNQQLYSISKDTVYRIDPIKKSDGFPPLLSFIVNKIAYLTSLSIFSYT